MAPLALSRPRSAAPPVALATLVVHSAHARRAAGELRARHAPQGYGRESASSSFQMLICRVSGMNSTPSTNATAGTTIG